MPPSDVTIESAGVAATFRWAQDRYEHTLAVGGASCASAPSDGFATPVFTEVHRQEEALFLSGMSGEGYWSATVEPVEEGLLFDVALRLKADPRRVASCYDGATACLQPLEDGELDGERITPRGFDPDRIKPPATIRYRYRVAAG